MFLRRWNLQAAQTAARRVSLLHSLAPCQQHARPSGPIKVCISTGIHQGQVRGKKTKATIRFDDLPSLLAQGQPLEPLDDIDGFQSIGSKRGTRGKTVVELQDSTSPIPQGLIPLDPLPLEDEAPDYPTVILQAQRNMQKFENCVLLTRVGGFYELYFEQAEEYGPLMNLKVGAKPTKKGPVPMVLYFSNMNTLFHR